MEKYDFTGKFNDIQMNIGGVIKAFRKQTQLKQAEMASLLNINQSTFSKLERGVISTSTENWLMFSHQVKLNFDAPLSGQVDLGEKCNFEDLLHNKDFNIPHKFLKNRCLSSRLVYPIIQYLRSIGHGKKINEYFSAHKIDADYFAISHNTVNSYFLKDLLEHLGLKIHQLKINQLIDNYGFKKIVSEIENNNHINFISSLNKNEWENIYSYLIHHENNKTTFTIQRLDYPHVDVEISDFIITLYRTLFEKAHTNNKGINMKIDETKRHLSINFDPKI